MTGYVRQSDAEIKPGLVVRSLIFNNEFNALATAFSSTGHTHDGSVGNGPKLDINAATTGILPASRLDIPPVDLSGYVKGPTTSVTARIAEFADQTGKVVRQSDFSVAGVLSRGNHTGEQAIGTITGLQEGLNLLTTQVSGKLDKSGGTMTGPLITSVTPTANTHVVNKGYVDSATSPVTTTSNGVMTAGDKVKLNGIAAGAQVNTVTSVFGRVGEVGLTRPDLETVFSGTTIYETAPNDSNDLFLTQNRGGTLYRHSVLTVKNWVKTFITKSDVGLTNVDNTSDANKPISTATKTYVDNNYLPTSGGTISGPLLVHNNIRITQTGGFNYIQSGSSATSGSFQPLRITKMQSAAPLVEIGDGKTALSGTLELGGNLTWSTGDGLLQNTGYLQGSYWEGFGDKNARACIWKRIDLQMNTRAPTSHTHSATDINSGTLADARIPNLNASKITAGVLNAARIPNLPYLDNPYTGTTKDYLNFPVGTTLIAHYGRNASDRNASLTVRLFRDSSYTLLGNTTALSGAWRARGLASQIESTQDWGGSYYLVQRVS